MKLHHCPQTRAFTALWMMEEAGKPYEIVRVNIRAPGHPTDAYKKINPMGKVAGLEDNGIGFGETAAILLYVADKFP
ncbi:MAG: glutathione S-transferase N-terminal domain-containing protein, partial [Micropepsaceae bacterium]